MTRGVIICAIATYLEWQFPRRDDPVGLRRWYKSVLLYLVVQITVPLLATFLPLLGYALAKWSEAAGGGLLALGGLPFWFKIIVTILILDFLAFLSHFVMHRINLFWRLHRVHHSDPMLSASTSFLHHPFESLFVNSVGVILTPFLGLQGEGILIFSLLQFLFNIWHHSNVANIPGQFAISAIIFTPDLHRVHHSVEAAHHSANLGIVFTFWDRLFGTFVRERDLDKRITFGLNPTEWDHAHTFKSLLVDPFRK